MSQIPRPTLLALIVALVVAPVPAAAGGWHGDVSYAATAWSDPTFWFEGADGHLDREGTLLDGGVVADVGWWATPWLSPLLQVAVDVERATWTSDRATRDPTVLRTDLLGGLRLAPSWAPAAGSFAFFADVLTGVEAVRVPSGAPELFGTDADTAPAVVLSLGALAGTGRIRAVAAVRWRYNAFSTAWMSLATCLPDSPCISWGYAPGGATVQILLGAAFR